MVPLDVVLELGCRGGDQLVSFDVVDRKKIKLVEAVVICRLGARK